MSSVRYSRTRLRVADQRIKSVTKPRFPTDRELVWAILDVLKDRGSPMPTSGIPLPVARKLSLPPEVVDWMHKTGTETELYYRVRWILKKLKDIGVADNAVRGYWALTKARGKYRYRGDLHGELIARFGPEIIFRQNEDKVDGKRVPLDRLRNMDRNSFETTCRKFLLKFGLQLINVTKRTKNGFEGTGILRIDFTSFRVFFRCLQRTDPINQVELISLRRAISGRTEKGLFITTSTFHAAALKEAGRDIVPSIDLIDGTELCDHLERLGIRV